MRFNIPFYFLFIKSATSFYVRGSYDYLPSSNYTIGEFIRYKDDVKIVESLESINKKFLK